jgi:hypothetical protein
MQSNKHGNSNSKVHKAHKNHKKHGKHQCRTYPNHDQTWADCFDNPKGKNYRGNKSANHNNNAVNKNLAKKAEAQVLEVDSDTDMDHALTTINLNEEVSNKMVELEDSKPIADNNVPPLPPSPVNQNIDTEKQSVTSALSERSSIINSMPNKKQRLSNKHHFCHMQTPNSRKLHKADGTNVPDLTTEVSTALIKISLDHYQLNLHKY